MKKNLTLVNDSMDNTVFSGRIRNVLLKLFLSAVIACLLLSGYQAKASSDGSGSYGRESCNESEKAFYDAIDNAIKSYIVSESFNGDLDAGTAEISIKNPSEGLTSADARYIMNCYRNDHPELYWLAGRHTYWTGLGDKLVSVSMFVDNDYYLKTDRTAADDAIASKTAEWNSILSGIESEGVLKSREYMLALRLHDLIIDEVDYRMDNNQPSSKKSAHSIVGVMDGSGVVCEGYAKTFQYFLNLQGVENIYVTGTADGGGHAWNLVKIGESYFCVDVTWDDLNGVGKDATFCGGIYDNFCMPISSFSKKHTSDKKPESYELPEISDNSTYVFYNVFKSLTKSELTDDNVAAFIDAGMNGIYRDVVYFAVPSASSVKKLRARLSTEDITPLVINSVYGYVVAAPAYKVNNPATKLTLTVKNGEWSEPVAEEEEIRPDLAELPVYRMEAGESVRLQAVIEAASGSCDDIVFWNIQEGRAARLSPDGEECTVIALQNGTVVVRARAFGGSQDAVKPSEICRIIIGDGRNNPLYQIWAGGDKNHKSAEIHTSLTATSYKDGRGKLKQGKLVWLVKNEESVLEFDTAKNTVKTKSDKSCVSVSKGKVTAKTPGKAFVYCVDTGSLEWECFEIEVLQATSKMGLSTNPEADKSAFMKNIRVMNGDSKLLAIIPDIKNGTASAKNTYKVEFAKPEDAKYLEISDVIYDKSGTAFFNIRGVEADATKKRPAKPKLIVTNIQSGKKVTLTVNVDNPVLDIKSEIAAGKLEKKNDKVTIKLTISDVGGKGFNTDKIKLYLAGDCVSVQDLKKVVCSGKTTVKAKYDTAANTITLTASKDCGAPAVVAMACTNPITKEVTLYKICHVTETGEIIAG